MHAGVVVGVGKGVQVSSFQLQEWYILGVGKGVVFRGVPSFQGFYSNSKDQA